MLIASNDGVETCILGHDHLPAEAGQDDGGFLDLLGHCTEALKV
jgi:hypothetical protein